MFEENLKYKGDILLVAYIDFETTAPTDHQWIDPKIGKCLLFLTAPFSHFIQICMLIAQLLSVVLGILLKG